MRSPQPTPALTLQALALAQAADLAAAYDGDAPAAARAGFRHAEQQGDASDIELWRAVCAIFDGERQVEL